MKIKKDRYVLIYFVLMVIMICLLILAIKLPSKKANIPALSLQNFLNANIQVEGSNILLTVDCYRIIMMTTLEQTESISQALYNITSARPNIHDLFVHTLKNFGISLLLVKIHSLKEGTYYSTIFLRKGNEILALDARPSDAIAIALRVNAPVYLNKELLRYAEKVC